MYVLGGRDVSEISSGRLLIFTILGKRTTSNVVKERTNRRGTLERIDKWSGPGRGA